MTKKCPFCTILETESERIIASRPHSFIIFSNPRLMPGHLLVIPKRHIKYPAELTVKERKDFFDTALEYQAKILERIAPGCDMSQHTRPFLPESRFKVDHVHMHLYPRKLDDELHQKSHRFQTEMFQELSQDEAIAILKLLS